MYRVVTNGGLGNQMFGYAFARALENKTTQRVVFRNPRKLHTIFKLRPNDPTVSSVNNALYKVKWRLNVSTYRKIYRFDDLNRIHEWSRILDTPAPGQLHGYFQSPIYFKSILPQIHEAFTILPEIEAPFQQKFKNHLSEPYVAIHLRRGDYRSFFPMGDNKSACLPQSYFNNAIQYLKSVIDIEKLVIISDDVESGRAFSESCGAGAIFVHGTEIEDFQLMINASACIVSNSTYSWWGAFLGKKKTLVISPKGFHAFRYDALEYPLGITPQDWVQLPASS